MKSIKIFLWVFCIFFILGMALPAGVKAGEKDVIKQWITEDMEEETIERLEKLAIQREKLKVEKIKPSTMQLYQEAWQLEKLDKYDEARGKYQEILTLNPDENAAREYIAEIDTLQEQSREKEEKNKFRDLVREGMELNRKKEYPQAREKWEEALEYDPDNTGLKEYVRRARVKEVEEAEKQMLFEKNLEEKAAFAAIDKAYIPKSRIKEKYKGVEEKITMEDERKKNIEEKLDKVMISDLHLRNASLREVLERILLVVRDVNIFIDWTAISEVTSVSSADVIMTKEETGAEGGVKEAIEEAAAPASKIKTMDLNLDVNVPITLRQFLEYLMTQTRLKYRVDEHAVLISTPQALEKEDIVVKIYTLKYGMNKLRTVTLEPLAGAED